jgi:membrane protein DedA with SNARE-associated domain
MSEDKFWLYNMIGSIIWAISINLLGIYFIDNYEMILDNLGKVMLTLFVALFLYFYFFKREVLKKYMKEKEQEILEKEMRKNVRK